MLNGAEVSCAAFCGLASLSFEFPFLPAGGNGQRESLHPRGCVVPCVGQQVEVLGRGVSGVNLYVHLCSPHHVCGLLTSPFASISGE